ncbi:MAG: 3-hydroxyisobutyrate dehydrogenase [Massilia sp.]|nr:3-hydroxyisobutyrate dehydrogenase [Massilia sp.]
MRVVVINQALPAVTGERLGVALGRSAYCRRLVLKHEGAVIHSGDFTISQSPLKISVEAVERILKTTRDMGINAGFPEQLARLFRQADADRLGSEELAALIKVLRKPAAQPA